MYQVGHLPRVVPGWTVSKTLKVLYNIILHQVGHLPRVVPGWTVSKTLNSRISTFLATDYYHQIMRRYVKSNTESVSNSTTNQPKHVADVTEYVQLLLPAHQLSRPLKPVSELRHSFRIRASFLQRDGQEAHLGLRAVYVRGEIRSHTTRKRWRTLWWRSASQLNKWKR